MRNVLALCLLIPVLEAAPASTDQIRSSAGRAIALVQRSATGFYKTEECFSCHDHALPMLTFRLARERGIAVDEAAASQVAAKGLSKTPDLASIDRAVQDNMIIDTADSDGWALMSADAAGVKPNLVTAVYARRIALSQRADGHWATTDARPPLSYSEFAVTAVALRAMQLYMPAELGKESGERQARAISWLLAAAPRNTEDYTYRLFGLYWAGAEDLSRAAHDLVALQGAGGGWAQLPYMQPDAYSTGQALVALSEAAGIPVSSAAYQKGLQFLLSTQDDPGSWRVHTRMLSPAPVSPPYLESGFPYGHDQYLSTDATCWAAMALMRALPEAGTPDAAPPLASLAPKGVQPWMEKALFGTPAEFKAQLDGGLDPNSKTPEGTTLAMMVAHDPAKLKLAIDRGADITQKAQTGFTALMVATTYPGTTESVKLLLAHGAEARPGKGVQFNASPLFLATLTDNCESVALLLAKGADPTRKMILLGMFPTSPLFYATGYDDPALVRALLAGGADVHEKDQDGMTALDWAVVAHHAGALKALLANGAAALVNQKDRFGYTPLLYAASVDFGDTEIVESLLKAGADPKIGDKDGKTPLAHAREYPQLRAALESAGAK
jgi:ankyrin repeat protein